MQHPHASDYTEKLAGTMPRITHRELFWHLLLSVTKSPPVGAFFYFILVSLMVDVLPWRPSRRKWGRDTEIQTSRQEGTPDVHRHSPPTGFFTLKRRRRRKRRHQWWCSSSLWQHAGKGCSHFDKRKEMTAQTFIFPNERIFYSNKSGIGFHARIWMFFWFLLW